MRRRLDRTTAGGRAVKGSEISVTVATQIAIPYAAATASVIATSFASRPSNGAAIQNQCEPEAGRATLIQVKPGFESGGAWSHRATRSVDGDVDLSSDHNEGQDLDRGQRCVTGSGVICSAVP
jgi:hypothetical protein